MILPSCMWASCSHLFTIKSLETATYSEFTTLLLHAFVLKNPDTIVREIDLRTSHVPHDNLWGS